MLGSGLEGRTVSLQWVELQRLSSSLMEHDELRPIVKDEFSNKSMFCTLSGFIEINRPINIFLDLN